LRGSFRHAAKLALDVALPTLRVARREPVVCAECWSKLSFIAKPPLPAARHPFVDDPGPELLLDEAVASSPGLHPRLCRDAL